MADAGLDDEELCNGVKRDRDPLERETMRDPGLLQYLIVASYFEFGPMDTNLPFIVPSV